MALNQNDVETLAGQRRCIAAHKTRWRETIVEPSHLIRRLPRDAARGLLVALAALPLAGCGSGILTPVGPVGVAQRTILFNSLSIMMLLVVPILIATVAFAFWFRASNARAAYAPDWAYSGRLEFVVWAIPALMIMFLGGIAWIGAHDLDPAKPLASPNKALEVQVVSLDWKWLFIYPDDGVASVNELVIPVGTPVHFTLTSATVFNTFWVPQLGSMIYTMAGMADQLYLQADTPGSYRGRSGHFSGDGFPGMHFMVEAKTPDDYGAWIKATKGQGPALDAGGYAELAKQSKNVKPFSYGSVDSGLFHTIVMQTAPEAPGPTEGHPNASVSPSSKD